jgi:hypothetical protein
VKRRGAWIVNWNFGVSRGWQYGGRFGKRWEYNYEVILKFLFVATNTERSDVV